jgi:hypothetical protein
MITPNDVVVDPVLSNVSVAYKNEEYIAEKLFPVLSVSKQTGVYYKFDKSALRRNKTLRAAGSPANEVEYGLTTDSFTCQDHALKEKIPFEVIDQADAALNPEIDAAESATEMLLVDKELSLATAMATTGTITQNVTLSGTDQWSDFNNSDPFDDIRTAIDTVQAAIGRRPNTLVFGQQAFNKLVDHPDIVERIKYSMAGAVTPDLIARLFDVKQVLVGSAVYNSAVEGQTDALSYIWGKHAWACYVADKISLKMITMGLTLTYKTREVEKWDDADAKSRYVRAHDNYTQEFVATEACYLIKNAVA